MKRYAAKTTRPWAGLLNTRREPADRRQGPSAVLRIFTEDGTCSPPCQRQDLPSSCPNLYGAPGKLVNAAAESVAGCRVPQREWAHLDSVRMAARFAVQASRRHLLSRATALSRQRTSKTLNAKVVASIAAPLWRRLLRLVGGTKHVSKREDKYHHEFGQSCRNWILLRWHCGHSGDIAERYGRWRPAITHYALRASNTRASSQRCTYQQKL